MAKEELAREALLRAIEIDPEHMDARISLSMLYSGRERKAKKADKKCWRNGVVKSIND